MEPFIIKQKISKERWSMKMPEMPEVEVIRRIIEPQLADKKFESVEILNGQVIAYPDADTFAELLTGQTMSSMSRDALTPSYLKYKLGKRKKSIKEMLHDQSIIAGIGNIYSDEILFAAGVYPETKCTDLEDSDWNRLPEKIKEILAWGIEANEMTPEEYLAGKGKEYRNIPLLRVYGRAGQQCRDCGSVIEKITIGGRSSCYCPICQKVKLCP